MTLGQSRFHFKFKIDKLQLSEIISIKLKSYFINKYIKQLQISYNLACKSLVDSCCSYLDFYTNCILKHLSQPLAVLLHQLYWEMKVNKTFNKIRKRKLIKIKFSSIFWLTIALTWKELWNFNLILIVFIFVQRIFYIKIIQFK